MRSRRTTLAILAGLVANALLTVWLVSKTHLDSGSAWQSANVWLACSALGGVFGLFTAAVVLSPGNGPGPKADREDDED